MHHGRQNITLTPIEPTETIGAGLIGSWVGWWITGLNTFGAWYFHQRFPRDPLLNKAIVIFLVLLECVYTIGKSWEMYEWGVQNFGNILNTFSFTQGHIASTMLGSFITFYVQANYAKRAWDVSKLDSSSNSLAAHGKWWAPLLIVCGSAISLGFGWALAIQLVGWDGSGLLLAANFTWGIRGWFGAAAGTDVLITILFSFFLSRARTEFEFTNSVLTRILLMTAQTNALTTVFAVLEIGLFGKINEGVTSFVYDLLCHCYCISLMVTLLFTRPPRWAESDTSTGSGQITSRGPTGGVELRSRKTNRFGENSLKPPASAINVHTVTYADTEDVGVVEKGSHAYAETEHRPFGY